MSYRCSVFKCPNDAKFRAPRNDAIRTKWIQALRLDEIKKPGSRLSKSFRICSAHFKPTDFIQVWKGGVQLTHTRRQLKRNAVPSLDLTSYKDHPLAITPTSSTVPNDIDSAPRINPALVTRTYSRTEMANEIPIEYPITFSPDSENEDPLKLSDEEDKDYKDIKITSSADINKWVEISIDCPPGV